jgi:hypothetical protein
VKWHLAGQVEIDARSSWKTISDTYRSIPLAEMLAKKRANLGLLFAGDWTGACAGAASSASRRQADEYYHFFRSLGWWNLTLPVAAASLLRPAFRSRFRATYRQQLGISAWVLSTLFFWCLLMFNGTYIHQGSFAPMIAIFSLYACWLELASSWCLICLAVLQAYNLVSTWLPGSVAVGDTPQFAAILLIVSGLSAWAAIALRTSRAGGPTLV